MLGVGACWLFYNTALHLLMHVLCLLCPQVTVLLQTQLMLQPINFAEPSSQAALTAALMCCRRNLLPALPSTSSTRGVFQKRTKKRNRRQDIAQRNREAAGCNADTHSVTDSVAATAVNYAAAGTVHALDWPAVIASASAVKLRHTTQDVIGAAYEGLDMPALQCIFGSNTAEFQRLLAPLAGKAVRQHVAHLLWPSEGGSSTGVDLPQGQEQQQQQQTQAQSFTPTTGTGSSSAMHSTASHEASNSADAVAAAVLSSPAEVARSDVMHLSRRLNTPFELHPAPELTVPAATDSGSQGDTVNSGVSASFESSLWCMMDILYSQLVLAQQRPDDNSDEQQGIKDTCTLAEGSEEQQQQQQVQQQDQNQQQEKLTPAVQPLQLPWWHVHKPEVFGSQEDDHSHQAHMQRVVAAAGMLVRDIAGDH